MAAVSGAALLLFMFLPWYGVGGGSVDVPGGDSISTPGVNANAWEVLSYIDILLFLIAVVAIGLVVARAADALPAGLPAPPGTILLAAGALAVLLILFRILSVPGPDVEGFEIGRKIGIFLSLIAAGGIAFGGHTASKERTSGAAPRR